MINRSKNKQNEPKCNCHQLAIRKKRLNVTKLLINNHHLQTKIDFILKYINPVSV